MFTCYCGICDQEYNFAGTTEYPSVWIDRHIMQHERRQTDYHEDIAVLRAKKPLHSKADILNKAHQIINHKDSK